MAKEIKFTDDELKTLGDLQVSYNTITNKFGQLTIAKLNIERQLELMGDEEDKLNEELESAREEEQKVLNEITEKYGPGQLDPQTGVFTPSPVVDTSTSDSTNSVEDK